MSNPIEGKMMPIERSLLREIQAVDINKKFSDRLDQAIFLPSDPINIINRELSLSEKTGQPVVIRDGERLKTLYQGIFDYTFYKFGNFITSDLLSATRENFEGEDVINLTDTEEEEKIWQRINGSFVDSNGNLKVLFDAAKDKVLLDILRSLQKPVPLILYEKSTLDGVDPTIIDDEGEGYDFNTKIEGIKASYFYPTGSEIAIISLKVNHIC